MLRSCVRPARRRWLLLAAVAMLASGCASVTSAGSTLPSGGDDDDAEVGPPQYGGRMVYGLEAETTNGWCLQEGQLAISGIQVARTIYDTLTVPDGDGGFRPYLAESLQPNADYTQWTVRLRDGVVFHDGSPLTAAVVKNNLDAYRGQYPTRSSLLFVFVLQPKRNVERSGSVLYDGQELVGLPTDRLRQLWGTELAMVFQDPMTALNPVLKIGNQITEGLRVHLDLDRRAADATALQLLRSVGIPEPERRLKQYPHELSGGMRQRVMIAVALACGPKVLFADEPTTALDVTVQAQILNLLAHQQRERDMAVILVTHDLGVVAGRADDIAVMYAGQLVEVAPTAELFANVRMPYTEALLRSIPMLEHTSHTRLQVIPGQPPDLAHPPRGCRFAPRCPYARESCHTEPPPLVDGGNGHLYRCWYPVGHDTATPVSVETGAR